MDKLTVLALFLLVALGVVIAYAVKRNRKTKALFREASERRSEWIRHQLQNWRDGKIESKIQPSFFGKGEVIVIEPEPGCTIIVGTVGKGKSIINQ
jgi:uncharacterized membrane protein